MSHLDDHTTATTFLISILSSKLSTSFFLEVKGKIRYSVASEDLSHFVQ